MSYQSKLVQESIDCNQAIIETRTSMKNNLQKYVECDMSNNNYLTTFQKSNILDDPRKSSATIHANNLNQLRSKNSKTCSLIWCCYCCCCCRRNCYMHAFNNNRQNSCSKIFDEIQRDSISKNVDVDRDHFIGLTGNEFGLSMEEVESWKVSFDNLMSSSVGKYVFRNFLRYEYSEENMAFWLACEELKNSSQNDDAAIEKKVKTIYDEFVSVLSSTEVSLDSKVRENINKNLQLPKLNIFDEAQLQIYTLMKRDSYPRFLNSHLYKSILNSHSNNNETHILCPSTMATTKATLTLSSTPSKT